MRKHFLLELFACVVANAAPHEGAPTFYKNVMPILQRDCHSCYRPGEVAPMSFLTFESARPWTKAIKEAVVLKKMPPWFADPAVGHFSNDRTLSQADIDVLAFWPDAGAPVGSQRDAATFVREPRQGDAVPQATGQRSGGELLDSRIECTAHYTDSVNNTFNADPLRKVRWGNQSWEEMMIGTVDVSPAQLIRLGRPGAN